MSLLLAIAGAVVEPPEPPVPAPAPSNPMYGGPRLRSKHAIPCKWVWLPVCEEEKAELLEEAAQIVVDVVTQGGGKQEAKRALGAVLEEIPAFDWGGYYEAADKAHTALQSSKPMSPALLRDEIFERIRAVERLRQQIDDDDVEMLLLYGIQ